MNTKITEEEEKAVLNEAVKLRDDVAEETKSLLHKLISAIYESELTIARELAKDLSYELMILDNLTEAIDSFYEPNITN